MFFRIERTTAADECFGDSRGIVPAVSSFDGIADSGAVIFTVASAEDAGIRKLFRLFRREAAFDQGAGGGDGSFGDIVRVFAGFIGSRESDRAVDERMRLVAAPRN